MCAFRRQPFIYEINTWIWLAELSRRLQRPVDLGSVPATVWDSFEVYGFDAIWFMGVWERSAAGIAIANKNAGLTEEFRRTLPDFSSDDNVGSAYCVRRYEVDTHVGGPEGLTIARQELARRGIGLLLDFVPNHVAPDAPGLIEHPEHFMQGIAQDLENHPDAYIGIGEKVFALGRDPNFAAWPDVVQVNAFDPGFRAAVIDLVLAIAEQCDGIRCDMAMLLINDIFARTWVAKAPAKEFWPEVIGAVRQKHPEFLFLAEAYWDLEWTLLQQGFDYCYDKGLYDLFVQDNAEGVRRHLEADLNYQEKLVRFLENHDEPRAAAAFFPAKARVAALTMATIPGARLFYEGQLEGRKARVPVFLGRRPAEPTDRSWERFYQQLLGAVDAAVFREGQWQLCACSGWPDNQSWQKLGAWCWTRGPERRLVLVNLTAGAVQARVRLPWSDLDCGVWRLDDVLSTVSYARDGREMQGEGLYVELAAWVGQILAFQAPGV